MRHESLSYAVPAAPSFLVIRQYVATAFQLVAFILFKLMLFALVTSSLFFAIRTTLAQLPVPVRLDLQKSEKEQQSKIIQQAFRALWGKPAPQSFVEGIWLGAKSIRTKEVDDYP